MHSHPQLEYSPASGIQRFYLNSDHLDEDVAFITRHGITNIAVNRHKGYQLKDLNILLNLPLITGLDIQISGADLMAISKLIKLERLFLGAGNFNIDLSNFTALTDFIFTYQMDIKGLDKLKNLKSLSVSGASQEFFTEQLFVNYPHLAKLETIQCKFPAEMRFLTVLPALKQLELLYSKSPINLDLLPQVKHSLQRFAIKHSKRIINPEVIFEMHNLKWLSLVDSIPLEGADLIAKLPSLEVLIILGSSYFKNGDISILKALNLQHVSIDNKRHYNLKYEDMPRINAPIK